MQRADVVGASFSVKSLIALRLVLAHPERVDRLVLIDAAGLKPTTAERDQISANFGHSHSVASLLMPTDPQVLKHFLEIVVYRRKPPMPDWVLKQVMRELGRNREAKTRLCDVLESEQVDLAELAKIKAHTLIIWGRHDPLLLESIGERMAHAMPDAKLVVFEEGAHSSMLEQPSRFNAVASNALPRRSELVDGRERFADWLQLVHRRGERAVEADHCLVRRAGPARLRAGEAEVFAVLRRVSRHVDADRVVHVPARERRAAGHERGRVTAGVVFLPLTPEIVSRPVVPQAVETDSVGVDACGFANAS